MGIHCLRELPRPARLERSDAREGHERPELILQHLPPRTPLLVVVVVVVVVVLFVVVVVVVVVVLTVCYTRESVLPRALMHLIGWQNTWEQAPGVPATPSPP